MNPEILEAVYTKLSAEQRETIKAFGGNVWERLTIEDIESLATVTPHEIAAAIVFVEEYPNLVGVVKPATSPYAWSVSDKAGIVIVGCAVALCVALMTFSIHYVTLVAAMFLLWLLVEVSYFLWDKYRIPQYNTNEEIAKGNIAVAQNARTIKWTILGCFGIVFMFISNVSGDPNSESDSNKGANIPPITIQLIEGDTSKSTKPDSIRQRKQGSGVLRKEN